MLPKYVSHKTVKAAQILSIDKRTDKALIGLMGISEPLEVSNEYMERHEPQVGGYFVEYEDGYQSFSPAKAFEGGYTKLEEVVEDAE